MDEAKSMFQIGTYHNHIVNLQGITCKEDKSSNQKAPEVSVNILYNRTILFFVISLRAMKIVVAQFL